MNGPHDKLDFVPDPSSLTVSEEGMMRRIEDDNVLEYREEEVREAAHKKLWTQFQQTAAALTQLYRDQAGREGLAWQPFQTAAGSLTLLYRDSLEEQRLSAEINRKLGYHRSRRDVLSWARGKRRFIRREELLSFLVQSSPGQSISSSAAVEAGHQQHPHLDLGSRLEQQQQSHRSPNHPSSPQQQLQQQQQQQQQLPSLQDMLELSRLEGGMDLLLPRSKRPAPPSPSQDESMDSPSSKRSRFN